MEPSNALLFAASGAVLGLVGRIVYDWLKNPRYSNGNGHKAMQQDLAFIRQYHQQHQLGEKINWLKDVHSKTDANGMPLVYFPSDLRTTTQENNQLVRESNQVLSQVKEITLKNNQLLERIDRNDRHDRSDD